ncbi:hypothetical protein C7B65_06150 [Phormidesmis priestleyi ULC007]|uniref:Uncharacterized protein n=2 Tax=Phormidesmis priestleyi TaxID=268141 RepID=A0A2T1DKK0_9CYAN|nr:hypothetical protein C7B65_06150 [Phormidesmis priestleyi ULC007]PZO53683.1 MAG: hypothetical protein DCF14_04700 [Phormidesmis priestleyi]
MAALHDIAQQIANNGDSAWQQASQPSSLGYDFLDPNAPVHYVKGSKGTLVVQVLADNSILGQDTPDYKQAGIATTYLVTDQGPISVIVNWVEKLGPAIASVAIAPALLAILGAFKTFLQSYLTRAYSAIAEGATDSATVSEEAATEAAEDAAIDGEVVADEVALSLTFSPLAIVGIAVAAIAAIIAIILFFLAKTMICLVKIFNYTDQTLNLALCYEYDLVAKEVPQSGSMPPIGIAPAPPGVKPLDSVIYRADYQFQNDSSVNGLGVVIHGDGSGDFPGMTAVIDIPAVGNNSLYVDLKNTEDWDQLYENIDHGQYDQLTMGVSNSGYQLSIATNQLRGESPSPITGETGYFYEYLIVIEKGAS